MDKRSIRLTKLAECAGCGAKVGAGELSALLGDLTVHADPNLLVGFDKSDDAAVYRISDELAMVQTVDFFPPIADDPYTFGAIAAANALSDIYAMGGEPKTCLNVMMIPRDMSRDTIHEILRGGYAKAAEAGAVICGGHSIYDPEPKYGMAVTGFVDPRRMLTNSGAKPGDRLIYTKPLGIGVATSAIKAELASPTLRIHAEQCMMTLNHAARDIMVRYECHACTDVTGFGLLGHALEMAQGSDTMIVLHPSAMCFLDETQEFAKLGILPEGMYRNRHFAGAHVDPGDTPLFMQDLLYDPQTSGGLLICVPPDQADDLLHELQSSSGVPCARLIGKVIPYSGGARILLD